MTKRATFYTLLIIQFVTVFSFLSCGVIRSLTSLAPNSDDYLRDPQIHIDAPENHFQFQKTQTQKGKNISITLEDNTVINLDTFCQLYNTEAFLIIRNDSIIFENYPVNDDYSRPVSSFSISKSIITSLTGIAIQEGYISNTDQYVWEFLPEWKAKGFKNLKIRHLMQHTSGMNFTKSIYNPTSDQVQFYYGRSLYRRMKRRKPQATPGETFDYQSANTILLTMVLEKASGIPIADYLESRLWQPLGMEASASWSLDRRGKKGMVRTFCCLQALARDFAKLGRLWMNNGHWDGKQIIPADYLQQIIKDERNGGRYRSGFRIVNGESNTFYTSGLLGQYIYMFPDWNLMILRFGEHRERHSGRMWRKIFFEIADQL